MMAFDIPRVVKMPVEMQATDALRDSIVSGAITAGARVTEAQISKQLSLSRATVRTALHQLAKEGLLTLVPYTGWTVVALSADDVWELYTLRSAIERLAAQILAKSINSAKAARLNWALEGLIKECHRGDRDRIAQADFTLHKTIIQLSGHSRLATQYSLIEQQIRMCIRSSDALIIDIPQIVDQHKPIVDAIVAGDAEASGHLSEQHNLTEGEKLTIHLRQIEQARASAALPNQSRSAKGGGRGPKRPTEGRSVRKAK